MILQGSSCGFFFVCRFRYEYPSRLRYYPVPFLGLVIFVIHRVVRTVFGTGLAGNNLDFNHRGAAHSFPRSKVDSVFRTLLPPILQGLKNALAVASDFSCQRLRGSRRSPVAQQNRQYGDTYRTVASATDLIGQGGEWIRHFCHRLPRREIRYGYRVRFHQVMTGQKSPSPAGG